MRLAIPRAQRDFSVRDYIPGQPIPTLVRDPRTGKVVVNELKRWTKPYWLVTDPALVTLAANATSDPIPMVIDGKGKLEIFDAFFISQRTEGFTVSLLDANDRPVLMNREIHVATIASGGGVTARIEGALGTAGSAGRPFRWPETFWMDPEEGGRALFATFRNLSASENQIRFALLGRRWYHMQAPSGVADRMEEIYRGRRRTFPYFYTTDAYVSLAGSASGTFPIRFSDVAWTEWMKAMSQSDGRYTVRIVERASGKRLNELPMRDDTCFGNGELPGLLWETSLFEPNFALNMELTDLSTQTNNIYITLACRQVLWDPKEDELRRPGVSAGVI